MEKSIKEANQFNNWIEDRFLWAEVLTAIRKAMIKTESSMRNQYGKQVGVWVAAFNKRDADDMDFEDMGMGMGMEWEWEWE